MLPQIEEWGSKIFNDPHASHYLFCYISKPQLKIKQKSVKQKSCDDFNVAHCWPVNIVYLSTSRDAIWTNRVQVFCVEVYCMDQLHSEYMAVTFHTHLSRVGSLNI